MSGDELVWADPPTLIRANAGRVARFVEALRERPGEWAIYPHPVTARVASQSQKRYPDTEWTVRNVDKDDQVIYARFVGEVES